VCNLDAIQLPVVPKSGSNLQVSNAWRLILTSRAAADKCSLDSPRIISADRRLADCHNPGANCVPIKKAAISAFPIKKRTGLAAFSSLEAAVVDSVFGAQRLPLGRSPAETFRPNPAPAGFRSRRAIRVVKDLTVPSRRDELMTHLRRTHRQGDLQESASGRFRCIQRNGFPASVVNTAARKQIAVS
jgi:hypothetical protein